MEVCPHLFIVFLFSETGKDLIWGMNEAVWRSMLLIHHNPRKDQNSHRLIHALYEPSFELALHQCAPKSN